MEFKAFPKIERIGNLFMTITQKIHGSNAQIVITEDGQIQAGSRNRWISVGDDNYGFASFVEENKTDLIDKLGVGQHFGEWAGPGINSGEGLPEKRFILFDVRRYPPARPLPERVMVVPTLYQGMADFGAIESTMNDLKTNGSKLVPGFMRPEGVVIELGGVRYKKVFVAEETNWKKADKVKVNIEGLDVSHLLQPVRMEKLISRDENYIKEYPSSLPILCKAYVQDLVDEGQLTGDADYIKAVRRALGSNLFKLAKEILDNQQQT